MNQAISDPSYIEYNNRLLRARRELYLQMMVIPFQYLWSRRDTLTLAAIQADFPPDLTSVGRVTEFQIVEHEGRQALSLRFVELHEEKLTAHLLYLPGAKPQVLCELYIPAVNKRSLTIGYGGWLNALTKLVVRIQIHYDDDLATQD